MEQLGVGLHTQYVFTGQGEPSPWGEFAVLSEMDLPLEEAHEYRALVDFINGDLPAPAATVSIEATDDVAHETGDAAEFTVTRTSVLATDELTVSYSVGLKRIPFVDLAVLALLYTLRLAMGLIIAGHEFSTWLLVFSMALFFSLSTIKRSGELMRLADGQSETAGRGYLRSDLPLLNNFGVATSIAALVILVLYLENEAFVHGVYVQPAWLWVAPGCLLLWVCRLWFLAHRGKMHADPVIFALTDKYSWMLAIIMGGALLLSHLPQ